MEDMMEAALEALEVQEPALEEADGEGVDGDLEEVPKGMEGDEELEASKEE